MKESMAIKEKSSHKKSMMPTKKSKPQTKLSAPCAPLPITTEELIRQRAASLNLSLGDLSRNPDNEIPDNNPDLEAELENLYAVKTTIGSLLCEDGEGYVVFRPSVNTLLYLYRSPFLKEYKDAVYLVYLLEPSVGLVVDYRINFKADRINDMLCELSMQAGQWEGHINKMMKHVLPDGTMLNIIRMAGEELLGGKVYKKLMVLHAEENYLGDDFKFDLKSAITAMVQHSNAKLNRVALKHRKLLRYIAKIYTDSPFAETINR